MCTSKFGQVSNLNRLFKTFQLVPNNLIICISLFNLVFVYYLEGHRFVVNFFQLCQEKCGTLQSQMNKKDKRLSRYNKIVHVVVFNQGQNFVVNFLTLPSKTWDVTIADERKSRKSSKYSVYSFSSVSFAYDFQSRSTLILSCKR